MAKSASYILALRDLLGADHPKVVAELAALRCASETSKAHLPHGKRHSVERVSGEEALGRRSAKAEVEEEGLQKMPEPPLTSH